ncbi:uncharacterized protein LOC111613537 [Centruroides sculpturatus]|uniref:uncharacterized protein LOC111613537 n=1 Tax=Centruroides sculpturatus TaxID=218467 RepID=UPI000C6CD243|nr:uncharacterized protein LOC111613537 [Centruroides sculpturatus]
MIYVLFLLFTFIPLLEAIHIEEYDFIVVGSGAGGSVIANRLSKNASITVLLLEAGERPTLGSEILGLSLGEIPPRFSWNYTSVPSKTYGQTIKNRQILTMAGKVLGGSTSVNAGVYTRGNKHDYDNWARNGAVGWDWKNVFPYFVKMEDNRDIEFVKNGYHGVGGELVVQFPPFYTSLTNAYIKAANSLGYPFGDYNGKYQTVFTLPQGTINKGLRWTAIRAFINPIIGRRNFRLITSALVTKVLIDDNNRAYGVLFDHEGKQIKALARKEVIVSAGTFNSPKLLMLSGIGPKEVLNKLNIPAKVDLPVGHNLHDHPSNFGLRFLADAYTLNEHRITKEDYNEILINGTGPLTSLGATELIGYVSSKYNEQPDWPDLEILWATSGRSDYLLNANEELQKLIDQFKNQDLLNCNPVMTRTKSRGILTLKSNNPYDDPIIDMNMFSHPDDLRVLVEGMKFCLKMAFSEPLKKFGVRPLPYAIPGCEHYEQFSDEYLTCMAWVYPSTLYHYAGTCKMGHPNDPTTVVDPTLKVKGIHGLRVADASIIPMLMVAHSMAPTLMIGEKVADIILHDI